jgi:hexosaminidase
MSSPAVIFTGIFFVCYLLTAGTGSASEQNATGTAAPIAIIPEPLHLVRGIGTFTLAANATILVDANSPAEDDIALMLAQRINCSSGLGLTVVDQLSKAHQTAIVLTTTLSTPEFGAEGYTLTVGPNGIVIRASGNAGLFYGTQTLLQLLPTDVFCKVLVTLPVQWSVPVVHIEDRPRFIWRGLMLDVSRHFFTKTEVLSFIDLMAQHKLNHFHWHLVDNAGWRIEIPRYPKLTSIGAWRPDIGFGFDAKASTAYGQDGRYGGFYTQNDIREVVAYASRRFVTVVPEIEMPAHTTATRAYPEYAAPEHPDIFCPGKDETFTFLENILSDVFTLFPSHYIHIGGDEVPRNSWDNCSKCQARMKAEGLKNVQELQSYMTRRIETFINAHGRTLIGWDEILEGGVAPNAVVMSWRGIEGGLAAAISGHDVVMTPTSNCYFDFYQAQTGEPKAVGGFLPLSTVYDYEPIPPGLPPNKVQHILGTDGNLWSEFIPNYSHLQYMTYPRACAIAEVGWTCTERKNWADFHQRLAIHSRRLANQGVHYRIEPIDSIADVITPASDGSGRLAMRFPFGKGSIHYTVDGSDPNLQSPPYVEPLQLAMGITHLRGRYYPDNSQQSHVFEALLLGRPEAIITTTLSPFAENTLERAFDGRDDTCFYADKPLVPGDNITLTMLAPTVLHSLIVTTGKPDRPLDIMSDGAVVEVSSDGTTFTSVGEFHGGRAEVDMPHVPILAVRIRAIAHNDPYWLVVREMTLH